LIILRDKDEVYYLKGEKTIQRYSRKNNEVECLYISRNGFSGVYVEGNFLPNIRIYLKDRKITLIHPNTMKYILGD